MRLAGVVCILALLPTVGLAQGADDAEERIIRYIKENLEPGERLIVSQLYNEVFTAPEERAALDKLNGAFFRIPLFIIEYDERQGRLPTLEDIAEQFDFYGPEEADVVLSIMESDPRVPKFLERDPETRELTGIDIEKVESDERFNKAVERSLSGWEGKSLPSISGTTFDGREIGLGDLDNRALLVYVWFTNCPPCVKIGPELVALQERYGGERFTVLGLNADRVLKLKYDDSDRADYAEKIGVNYTNVHLTAELRAALGNVNIFPTLFLVDRAGTVLKHYVNFQSREVLGPAIEEALASRAAGEQ